MFEYILGLSFIIFIFIMVNFRFEKLYGSAKEITPIVRFLIFIFLCIILIWMGLQSSLIRMDINVMYERLKVFPLFAGSLFYFIDYYTYSENKDDIKLAQRTLKNSFKNQIVFVLLMAFVFVSYKFHFMEKVIGKI